MNIHEEMQKVWDATPKEVQQLDHYAFVVSWDWDNTPTEFKGFPVYRFRPIPNQMIYFMPNPIWDKTLAE